MAFRMSPARFETLQVRGAQRVVLPLSTGEGGVVQAELPASAYGKDTGSPDGELGSARLPSSATATGRRQ